MSVTAPYIRKIKVRKVFFPIGPSIAYIPLTRGLWALIDREDAAFVGAYNWCAHSAPTSNGFYAARSYQDGERRSSVKMHRFILGPAPNSLHGDHANRETLDNRRSNLRYVTRAENQHNCHVYRSNRLGVKGVTETREHRYRANISYGGKQYYLGTYLTIAEASAARVAAEIEHFGEYSPAWAA